MAQSRYDLLFHPIRYRILRIINGENCTTQQITERLGDVPQSTVYRHLRLLLKGNIISVVDSHDINGITEKVYGADAKYHLTAEEFADLSKDEQIANMELFSLTMMQTFAKALEDTPDDTFDAMPLSYREYSFYATEEDFLEIRRTMFKMLRDAEKRHHSREDNRQKYKVNIVTHIEPDTN